MELHIIPPLSAMEEQFQSIYQIHATALGFDPLQASFQAYQALRQAMLHDLDTYMSKLGQNWHRMAAYLPDTLNAGDIRDFRYVLENCFARYIPLPEHASESYEIILCPYGFNQYYISQQPLLLQPGDVLLLGPGTVYAAGAFDRDCVRRSILLRRTRTQARFSILLEGDGPIATFLKHTVGAFGGNSWALFHMGEALLHDPWMQALYQPPLSNDPASFAMEDGLLMSFLANLSLSYGDCAELHLWQSPKVEDAIMECLRLEFATIERAELARRFGYSERQLLRIIQRRTGLSFREYLNELKLNYIADMLINTSYPITMILQSAGYDHNSTIYKLFRAKYNVSPKEFRQNRP